MVLQDTNVNQRNQSCC